MNTYWLKKPGARSVVFALCLPGSLLAQTSSSSLPSDREDVVELTPFEVNAQEDKGYIATGTLAGSRLATSLLDTPAAISVMTTEFLNDIGANDINDAIEYGVNSGNDIGGGSADVGATTGNGIRDNEFNIQIRGYRRATVTRDYFPTRLASDTFNVERVEVARGPNSLVFGVGGPGGLVNTTFKSAIPNRDFTDVMMKYGSWNERRATIDINRSLLDDKLALRVNGVYQKMGGWKDFAQNDGNRGAFALTYQPFENTKIKVKTEFGSMLQNRVRSWNLVDQISTWEGQGSYYIPFGTAESPWLPDDSNYAQTRSGGASNPNNGLSPSIPAGFTFERRTAHLGNPTVFMETGPLAGKWIQVGQRNEGRRYYRVSFHNNLPGYNTPAFVDESLAPRTANPMGPGATEDTDYGTASVSIDQKVGENLNLNFAASTTEVYRRRNTIGGFSGLSYKLDVTSELPTFTTDGSYNATEGGPDTGQGNGQLNFGQTVVNPLVGTPIFSYNANYALREEKQDDLRLSASYHLDLGAAGDHMIMAFGQSSTTYGENQNFNETNVSLNRPDRNYNSGNNFGGRDAHIDYFAPNLAQRGIHDPYKNPLPNSVLWGAPELGSFEHGWYRSNMSWSETTIDSLAVAFQSRFFENSLVTTIGGRRDKVSIVNSSNRLSDDNGEAMDFGPAGTPQDEEGDTYSIGAVYHLPMVDWLSVYANKSTNFQTQGGAQYFEDADLRSQLEIGALKGVGFDYGLKFNLLEGKIYASLGYFDVEQSNAATGFDGNVTSYINAIWTTIANGGPNTITADTDNPSGHRVGGSDTRGQASQGFEFELTANPTDNWRVSLNVSKSDNTVSSLGGRLGLYLEKHRAEWTAARGLSYDTGRSPGFLGNNTVGDLQDGLDRLLAFVRAGEGVPETNVRPINANLFTAYSFDEGLLDGLTIGGGANYRGDQIMGVNPATLTNPQAEIFKGGAYMVFNLLASYEFTFRDIPVRLQLNVDNLLDNDDEQILASRYNELTTELEPFYYYLTPRSYSISAKFSF
ncbi:TonB-dependent siderophore receptor [Synoicihabitans lomoniglobus]|uniref:TonB-dependent receptor plug domain-containing protein n=1 Tax=Synoicihabitans lomoniglobus TaxID=2909285 RepID=A0AAE9ZU81_9BACT|nr:TonB-dependent receptor plug domain-containing protein [Opitutaceae bacterium LMO-M01]WED63159.1 TonB-dependent receptor plug domain-containing protein [Opitutaceae bacterium LMO-M01]